MEFRTLQPASRLTHAYSYLPGSGFAERTSLLAALGFSPESFPRVCALVGGGGKTTTLFQLADELAENGRRMLVTTSTHFQCLYPEGARPAETSNGITRESWSGPVLTVGRPLAGEHGPACAETGAAGTGSKTASARGPKLAMPRGLENGAEIVRLLTLCDGILYEADGAKHHPAKVPRNGEPVFLPETQLVVACLGLGALGRTMRDACFRLETDGGWLRRPDGGGYAPEDRFDAHAAAQILSGSRGAAKDVPQGAAYRILLNQADDSARLSAAREIAERLPGDLRAGCAATAYLGPWSVTENEGSKHR